MTSSVRHMTVKTLSTLLTVYVLFFLQAQQACYPGNPLQGIRFQVDSCEDASYTKCKNIGYAISSLYGSVEISIPDGRYVFRVEDPQYKFERQNASVSFNYPTRIFYLYPPTGKCQ